MSVFYMLIKPADTNLLLTVISLVCHNFPHCLMNKHKGNNRPIDLNVIQQNKKISVTVFNSRGNLPG